MSELPKNIFDRTTLSEDLTNSIAKRHFDMQEKNTQQNELLACFFDGVGDGIRTHDLRDHNPTL